MASPIKISVDGEDGESVARHSGTRFVAPDNALALVRPDGSRDGLPGTDAPRATPGAPGGFLAVDLSESASVEEGINVRTLGFRSRIEPPQNSEVPPRRNVLLSAVGGRGESGHAGGDGQVGMNGADGTPATREVDATPGTDGGNGGNAGRGSNGANGGGGGTIEITVDEDNMHLLIAVYTDVRGGDGGPRGNHGQPGQGGRGGNEGAGYKWRETVDYRYRCTSSCIGETASTTSTSLARGRSVVGSTTLALMAPMRAQATVEGGNLQAVIASAAQWYAAKRHERIEPGSCHCRGGTGSCNGCDKVPIDRDIQRIPGRNGNNGRPGQTADILLNAGSNGLSGKVAFHVRNHDGSHQTYTSRYQLELVDFDVEDENGDGIFEPGEHIFIRRIRIRNAGEMPSPKCQIPISAVASKGEWFLPVTGQESYAAIPSLITPGVTVTLEGSIKVWIRRSEELQQSGSRLLAKDHLYVRATMPWLNRDLPHFEWSREIAVQYPIELRNIDVLPSIAPGSTSQFRFEVLNKGLRALGTATRRYVETHISFRDDSGSLLSSQDAWSNEVIRQIMDLPPHGSLAIQQKLRVAPNAENHQKAVIQVDLYLSDPIQQSRTSNHTTHEDTQVELQLLHRNEISVQISSHHTFSQESEFLLITNSKVSRDRVQGVQNFIADQLQMRFDEWNISLYGGLLAPGSAGAPLENIMTRYRGKAIVFVGSKLDYFKNGDREICELCEPEILAELCVQGTRFLFLENANSNRLRTMVRALVLPVPYQIMDSVERHEVGSHKFQSRHNLVESLYQQKVAGGFTGIAVYTLPINRRWGKFSDGGSLNREVKSLGRFLRQQLPQERFLVTSTRCKNPDKSKERLIVLHGVPRSAGSKACEPQPKSLDLSPLEAFMLVDTLPISTRVNLVWSLPAHTEPASIIGFRAAVLSLLLGINTEVHIFLHSGAGEEPFKFLDTGNTNRQQSIISFLAIQLPILAQLLQHPTAEAPEPPSEHIMKLLQYTLASCRAQKKRHIVPSVVWVPFQQRRRRLHKLLASVINDLLDEKVGKTSKFKQDFHTQVDARHSKRNKDGKRDTRKMIVHEMSEFTGCSDHVFQHAQLSSETVVPRTEWCTPDEWDRKFEAAEKTKERIMKETKDAWDVLGKMMIEA